MSNKAESGMAYVVLLALLAIMATLGLSFAFKVGIETSTTEIRSDGMQAQYLAEAAANHAMWRLLNDTVENSIIRVAHNDDDAEERDNGGISLGGNKLNLGEDRYIGVRFLNVSIPQGGTVTNAYITFKACDTDTEHTDITIRGENTDNAARFSANNGDLSGRAMTAAAVNWNDIPNWTDNEYYKTPDLTSIVQEIVNRPGWATGNAMVILFRSEDLGGQRRADTHDSITENAAALFVEYGDANTATPGVYHMHTLAGGRYGYKIRRHTNTTFATIATVGVVDENVVQQSYVLHVKPPSLNVLFVVRDASSLRGAEHSHKNLLESWGHAVEIIDQDDSQFAFDTAVARNDVAFTTNDIESSALGTKLTNAPIGVVTSECNLSDEFGMASGIDWDSGTDITITDNTLYITSPFSVGALTLLESSESLAYVSGTLSSDLTQLADLPSGEPAIVVLCEGATMYGGGTVAGRRVQLPWGGDSLDPINHLNADGRLILKRAIDWAATGEGGCGDHLCKALAGYWKLDESSGNASAWDSSENGNHGRLEDMDPLTDWVSGHLEGALDFDGEDDFVDAGSESSVDDIFDGGATVSAWIHPRGWGEGNFGRIFDKADNLGTNRNGWAFELYGSRQSLLFQQGFSGGIGNWVTPVNSISLNEWQHVALVYDSSFDTNDPVIYINGVPQTVTEIDTPSGAFRSDAALNLTIGNYSLDTNRTWDGLIDDLRIYDRALDSDEIDSLHTMTAGGCGSLINNPPFVDAGPDQSLGGSAVKTILDGLVADDGLPDPPKALTTIWSQVSGPGTVIFDDASALNTVALIPEVGIYTLRLTANDGELQTFDDLTIELFVPCNGTYGDFFDNPVFNGSNGTLDWSTSPWEEVGESDGPTRGDIRVIRDDGSESESIALRLKDNDNGGEGVERQVNLAGAAAAKLAFYYRRQGLDNANDYVKVEISANGAAGPWTELFRFQGPGTDAAYQIVEVDISAYATSNTRLRFLTSPNMGGNDIVWIDDVYMKCGGGSVIK